MLVAPPSIRQLQESITLDAPDGPFQTTQFLKFSGSCHVARAMGAEGLDGVCRQLTDITQRQWALLTIVQKLHWMQERRDVEELDPLAWMAFAASDVSGFLMNTRSLFDHVAKVIRITAGGRSPESFNKLRTRVAKHPLDSSLAVDTRLLELVANADWFDDLRDIRDDILHRAADTIVFPYLPYIGIQINKRMTDRLLTEPDLLDPDNANVARFEWFAVAAMGRIHSLLDDLAAVVQEILDVPGRSESARSKHAGLTVVHSWCEDFLRAHESSTGDRR